MTRMTTARSTRGIITYTQVVRNGPLTIQYRYRFWRMRNGSFGVIKTCSSAIPGGRIHKSHSRTIRPTLSSVMAGCIGYLALRVAL